MFRCASCIGWAIHNAAVGVQRHQPALPPVDYGPESQTALLNISTFLMPVEPWRSLQSRHLHYCRADPDRRARGGRATGAQQTHVRSPSRKDCACFMGIALTQALAFLLPGSILPRCFSGAAQVQKPSWRRLCVVADPAGAVWRGPAQRRAAVILGALVIVYPVIPGQRLL
jgi:hypothetical protein